MTNLLLRQSGIIFVVLVVAVSVISCKNKNTEQQQENPSNPKETLLKINQTLIKTEDQQIEDFIGRRNWKMEKTGSGLRYNIYKEGEGEKAELNKTARINYTVSLLSGDTCYSSNESGPKEFIIGKGGVESGLEEGILLLKVGDRAKFILPSRLAFGLLGDSNKIPAKATLIYDVNLLELK